MKAEEWLMLKNLLEKQQAERRRQLEEIDRKVSGQTWLRDFSSNIAGNAVWDAAVWIAKRLIRKM